jgi:hypothetical protein
MLAGVALTDSLPWLHTQQSADMNACLLADLNSYAFDYVARQKVAGLHLRGHYLGQLPIIALSLFELPCPWGDGEGPLRSWIVSRVLELTYTAWDLEPFACDCLDSANSEWAMANSEKAMASGKKVMATGEEAMANSTEGYVGYWQRYSPHSPFVIHHSPPPFRWDEERRFLLRCELDAAFFHLYLTAEANGEWRRANGETQEDLARLKASFPTPRDAVDYIMDTFPIVRRKDEEKYNGDYRTKRVILEIYDAMQEAIRTGQPYQTRLDPPPADPRCCHPPQQRSGEEESEKTMG